LYIQTSIMHTTYQGCGSGKNSSARHGGSFFLVFGDYSCAFVWIAADAAGSFIHGYARLVRFLHRSFSQKRHLPCKTRKKNKVNKDKEKVLFIRNASSAPKNNDPRRTHILGGGANHVIQVVANWRGRCAVVRRRKGDGSTIRIELF
jgi:hypothetical protein